MKVMIGFIKQSKGNENILIIDTKYKLVNSKCFKRNNRSMNENYLDEGENKIAMSDLYQMFTYSELYKTDVLLLYPEYSTSYEEEYCGPYYFKESPNSKKLVIGWLNLNFSENDWEKKMTKNLYSTINISIEEKLENKI